MKKRALHYEIDLEFGSEYQENCCKDIMDMMLGAAKIHIEARHKNNKMTATYEQD